MSTCVVTSPVIRRIAEPMARILTQRVLVCAPKLTVWFQCPCWVVFCSCNVTACSAVHNDCPEFDANKGCLEDWPGKVYFQPTTMHRDSNSLCPILPAQSLAKYQYQIPPVSTVRLRFAQDCTGMKTEPCESHQCRKSFI